MVDDDPAVHRLVSALFTPQGHVVEAVRSGSRALRMMKERDFDLIIADAMAAAGPSELFVQALAAQRPDACARLVLGVSGNGECPTRAPSGRAPDPEAVQPARPQRAGAGGLR